jgi:hypothetical protein
MKLTKILVAVSALMFAGFGLNGLLNPRGVLDLIHASAIDVTALNEVRAMYGGVELGIATFLVACLLERWPPRAGLFLTTAILVGAAGGRAKSIHVDGMPDATFVGIWVFELVFAAICLFALVRDDD